MARRSIARPSVAWAEDLPIVERRLDNGLRVLLLPRKVAPVVVCDLYYAVGSYDEPPGASGIAHFVEHMLFKGTEANPKGRIDQLTYLNAGSANAETGEDLTHYWFVFPADRWEIALEIEADRMRGALFDPIEVEAERQVIVEERARDQESPFQRLHKEHLLQSYQRHPYRNPIIGWPEDLQRIDAGMLREFHRRHYGPENALLVVIGDIRTAPALKAVERAFGSIPRRSGRCETGVVNEPRQIGRREFELLEPESVARGILGWQAVPSAHADEPALDIVSDLMSLGRRSRLWHRLVEDLRIATWVDASVETGRRAGQFVVKVEATPGVDPRRVEAEIEAVIRELAVVGPTVEELNRCRSNLISGWLWERENLSGLAGSLGETALWDDWRAWPSYQKSLLAVTVDDLQRVAATYLSPCNLTAGWSVPAGTSAHALSLPGPSVPRAPRRPSGPSAAPAPIPIPNRDASALKIDYRPQREVLPNGLRLLSERRPGSGVVALELCVDAGRLLETKVGAAYLTGRLLEEGTTHRSSEQLAEEIEDAGGSLETSSTGISLRIKSDDLAQGLEWMADIALRSNFPEDSVQWLKSKVADELLSDRDDPAFRAEALFDALIYGDHPYGRDPRGTRKDLSKLRRRDLLDHYHSCYTAENAFLVVVGDFDPKRLRKLVERCLGGWTGRKPTPPLIPTLVRSPRPKVKRVSQAGEQVHILMGHLGITRCNPDYDALRVVDAILSGGTGFSDRLGRVLRDELGLTYAVGGGITEGSDREPGLFEVSLGTAPELADLAVKAATEQIEAIHRGDFSDREIEQARAYLSTSWIYDFQTVEQRAGLLYDHEYFGLPPESAADLPRRLARLTPEAVRRAAARWINPGSLLRVEYGPILPRGQRAIA